MIQSILESTKKILGIEAEYTPFDVDIITHINSVFSTLNQLGIGPVNGFMIEDAEPTWDDFLGDDPRFNAVKSYVYLRVRLLFDPPTTSYLITALNEQVKELEWRLNVERELRDHPLPSEGSDGWGSGDADDGDVLTADGVGGTDWEPLTRVIVLDPDKEVSDDVRKGSVVLRRLE